MATVTDTNNQIGLSTPASNTTVERQKVILKNANDPNNSSWVGYGPSALEEKNELESNITQLAVVDSEGTLTFNSNIANPIEQKIEPIPTKTSAQPSTIPNSAYDWLLKQPAQITSVSSAFSKAFENEPNKLDPVMPAAQPASSVPKTFYDNFRNDPAHVLDPNAAVNNGQDAAKDISVSSSANVEPLNASEVIEQAKGIIAEAKDELKRAEEIREFLEKYEDPEIKTEQIIASVKIETPKPTDSQPSESSALQENSLMYTMFGYIGESTLSMLGKLGKQKVLGKEVKSAFKDLVVIVWGEKPDKKKDEPKDEKKINEEKKNNYLKFMFGEQQKEVSRSQQSDQSRVAVLAKSILSDVQKDAALPSRRDINAAENFNHAFNPNRPFTVKELADFRAALLNQQKQQTERNDAGTAIKQTGAKAIQGHVTDLRIEASPSGKGSLSAVNSAG